MGFLTWIRSRVGQGLVAYGGTIAAATDDAIYPIAIANELLGGLHGYKTLEDLAAAPIARLMKPMNATVLQHVRPDSTIYHRTTFIFDPSDDDFTALVGSGYDRISDIPGYDLSQYWKIDSVIGDFNATVESQFAPEVDYGGISGPGSPAFQPPIITSDHYQAGYKSDAELTVIWSNTYDPTVHKYQRQRFGSTGNWGIPILISQSSYTSGDYIDNRFIWVSIGTTPITPPSLINGQSNGDPTGWLNNPTPPGGANYYTYIGTHDLFQISVQKDVYGKLKEDWSKPRKISTNPQLVRYGSSGSATDFINSDGTDTPNWRGYFTPGKDTFMATRIDSGSAWRVQSIDNEAGEYVDYIFKAFPLNYVPISDDRPTIALPFSTDILDYPNNGWQDGPFAVTTGQALFRSVGRKYNNGALKPSGWSIPIRNDGLDVIQATINPQGADLFKYDADHNITPTTIVLQAILEKGNLDITEDSACVWFKGDPSNPANQIIRGSSVGVSAGCVISGSLNETLTISPSAVDGSEVFTVHMTFQGITYDTNYTVIDVADAKGFIAVINSTDGYTFKNHTGSKTFHAVLYNSGSPITSGVTYQWFLGVANITPSSGDLSTVTVAATDFTNKEVLKVNITIAGSTYSRTESLVDLADGIAPLIQYSTDQVTPTTWTTTPTGAYFMRFSTDGGATWQAAIRVKDETAPLNGGFEGQAYINSATPPTISPANGVMHVLLPIGTGWTAQPTALDPVTQAGWGTYRASAFFLKVQYTGGVINTNTALTDDNWQISGTWSTPVKINGIDGSSSSVAGPEGVPGWSPVFANVADGTRIVLRVVDWIHPTLGTSDPSKPATGSYVGSTGFVSLPSSAVDIRGAQGASGLAQGVSKLVYPTNFRTPITTTGTNPFDSTCTVYTIASPSTTGYNALVTAFADIDYPGNTSTLEIWLVSSLTNSWKKYLSREPYVPTNPNNSVEASVLISVPANYSVVVVFRKNSSAGSSFVLNYLNGFLFVLN